MCACRLRKRTQVRKGSVRRQRRQLGLAEERDGSVPLVLPEEPEKGEAGAREVRSVRAPAYLGVVAAQPVGRG